MRMRLASRRALEMLFIIIIINLEERENSRWQYSRMHASSPTGSAKHAAARLGAELGTTGVTRVHDHPAAPHPAKARKGVKVSATHRERVHAAPSFGAHPGKHRKDTEH